MPFIQGVDHPAFVTMVDHDMSLIPPLAVEAGPAAVEARNALRAQKAHENAINVRRRELLTREHQHRLALDLIASMRPHAGLRLKRLLGTHLVSGTIDKIDAVYDGVAMYKSLRSLLDETMSKPQRDAIKENLKKFEADPLKDGCTVIDFDNKVNTFTRDINPYLDRAYAGAALTEYIIEMMPPSLKDQGLTIIRERTRLGTLADEAGVISDCKTVVDAFAKPTAPKSNPIASANR